MTSAGRDPTTARAVVRRRQWIVAAAVVVFVGLWVLMIAVGSTGFGSENLDDEARAVVGTACQDAREALGTLGAVTEGEPPAAFAAFARAENEAYAAMVADAARAEPDQPDAATALDEWLADWRTLIDAREDYARELTEPDPGPWVGPTEPGTSRPLSVRMNEWARARGLEGCTPDTLQAERADRPRSHPG